MFVTNFPVFYLTKPKHLSKRTDENVWKIKTQYLRVYQSSEKKIYIATIQSQKENHTSCFDNSLANVIPREKTNERFGHFLKSLIHRLSILNFALERKRKKKNSADYVCQFPNICWLSFYRLHYLLKRTVCIGANPMRL